VRRLERLRVLPLVGADEPPLVVPTRHATSLEEIVPADLAAVYATAQRVAVALRVAYGCPGTSTRQRRPYAARLRDVLAPGD
jgi:hypothetical protein